MGACTSDASAGAKKEKGFFTAEYLLGVKLGEGRFGQVRLATHRTRSEVAAAKILDLRTFSDEDNVANKRADASKLKKARAEVNIMERIGTHEHCVQLLEAFQEKCLYYIVMEKCDATLMDELEQIPHYGRREQRRIFREMLLGIAHVHRLGLMHRDVKPNNFLFAGNSKIVKLSDFGMSVVVPKRGTVIGHFGTPPYMSPEMIGDKQYSNKADIWSYGVSIYVLLYGGFPYQPQEESSQATKKVILLGHPKPSFAPAEGSDCPIPREAATQFVRSMIARSPQQRPTAEDALQLEWVEAEQALSIDINDQKTGTTRQVSDFVGNGAPSPLQKESCQKIRDLQARVDNRAAFIAERDLDQLLERLNALNAIKRQSFSEDVTKSGFLTDMGEVNFKQSSIQERSRTLSGNERRKLDILNADAISDTSRQVSTASRQVACLDTLSTSLSRQVSPGVNDIEALKSASLSRQVSPGASDIEALKSASLSRVSPGYSENDTLKASI